MNNGLLSLFDHTNLSLLFIPAPEFSRENENKEIENKEEILDITEDQYIEYSEIEKKELVCPICKCVINGKVMITECFHRFCLNCISTSLLIKDECPMCRTRTRMDNVAEIKINTEYLKKVLVKCKYHDLGCKTVIMRDLYKGHIDTCEYIPVKCSCGTEYNKFTKEEHIKTCKDKPEQCQECGEIIKSKDMENHAKNICKFHCISCEFCGIEQKRCEIQSHFESCPNKIISCPRNCGAYIFRKDTGFHLNENCSLRKIYCEECKDNVILENHRLLCPNKIIECFMCKKKFKKQAVQEHNRVCENRIVKCPNFYYKNSNRIGCLYKCERHDMNAHLNVCKFRRISCDKCKQMITYGNHVCEQEEIKCEYCGLNIKRYMTFDHHSICTEKEIECRYNYVGCGSSFLRKFEKDHYINNTQKHLDITEQELLKMMRVGDK